MYVLEDFHFFIDEKSPTAPLLIRQLRDLVDPFKASRKTLVLLSGVLKLPPELEKDLTVVDLEMPGEPEFAALLDETAAQVKDNPKVEVNLGDGAREKIVKALTGLTRTEAENALAKVIVTRSRLDDEDVDLLLEEKEQIIRKSGMLEFYSTPERFGSIGGLDNLKPGSPARQSLSRGRPRVRLAQSSRVAAGRHTRVRQESFGQSGCRRMENAAAEI